MKTIKKYLFISLLASVVISCKKGENDPIISLASRKSRLANEWNISSWATNYKTVNNIPNAIYPNSSMSQELENNLFKRITTGEFGDNTEEGVVNSAIWTIEKNNTWSKTISYTSTLNNTTTTKTIKSNGTWYFLNKIDEYKNKERVVFNTTASTESINESYSNGTSNYSEVVSYFSDNEESSIFEINQLKNKETILIREQFYKIQDHARDYTTTISESFTLNNK